MTNSDRKFAIGRRFVGTGEPCYVIAEIGSNHNQDKARALDMIAMAGEAGADAGKVQASQVDRRYAGGGRHRGEVGEIDPEKLAGDQFRRIVETKMNPADDRIGGQDKSFAGRRGQQRGIVEQPQRARLPGSERREVARDELELTQSWPLGHRAPPSRRRRRIHPAAAGAPGCRERR